MRKIIGLLGGKGAGKDTCADYLVQERGYRRIGFADLLYKQAADAFGVTVAFMSNRKTKEVCLHNLRLKNCVDLDFVRCVVDELRLEGVSNYLEIEHSPRVILQLWGTEYRRRRGIDSYWLDKVRETVLAEPSQDFVVTDVRFLNEFNFIKGLGGLCVRVLRAALDAQAVIDRAKSGTASHPSETELLGVRADAELENIEDDPGSLRRGVFSLLQERAVT
jgi:hypothetical protein